MVVADWIDEETAKAVAVLATATIRLIGREAPVVAALQRLLQERSRPAYDAACASFDALDPLMRGRIAMTAPVIARRRPKRISLPGLLGAINRR
jgi:hypothetical protein